MVREAFSEIPLPTTPARDSIDSNSIADALEDLNLIPDDVVIYIIPKILIYFIESSTASPQNAMLCKFIEYIDVDFFDPEDSYTELKEVKFVTFEKIVKSQAGAIFEWLQFIHSEYDLSCCNDFFSSAASFWKERAVWERGLGTRDRLE